jgi:hypothetical protein
MRIIEMARDGARDSAFAGAGRTIDCDDESV